MTAGAGVAVAAAGRLAVSDSAAADSTTNPAGAPTGARAFAMNSPSKGWAGLGDVVNQDTSTTLQSIAFDSVNGHLYTLQVAGASSLAYQRGGKEVARTLQISGPQHDAAGDLCLSRHDIANGEVLDYMYLLGFGHGVSLGIEPAKEGTPAYVWTEAGADTQGYGREIARFPFAAGGVLWTSHPLVQRLAPPEPGAVQISPSVDATYGSLVLRYAAGGSFWFAAHDLAAARAAAVEGKDLPATPLAKVRQPLVHQAGADGKDTAKPATFQGFTAHGQYVYMLDGTPRTGSASAPLAGEDLYAVHTTSIDLNGTANDPETGYMQRTHSAADANADPREPEGMAVHTGPAGPRLCFGITDNAPDGTRRFDLYYKDGLMP
ncbi:hypothetical protein AB0M92_36370 [Streptomyces sp. NPDC051582]|uniref:hypothetical protein n=1 Tax=Streptomyces sp. NPDC051582 TaxID=3155167 RepID=UPI00341F728A